MCRLQQCCLSLVAALPAQHPSLVAVPLLGGLCDVMQSLYGTHEVGVWFECFVKACDDLRAVCGRIPEWSEQLQFCHVCEA